jgi:hypothetical protein
LSFWAEVDPAAEPFWSVTLSMPVFAGEKLSNAFDASFSGEKL